MRTSLYPVEKVSDVPQDQHFQVLVFTTRTEVTPSYGPPDPPGDTYTSVPLVEVYVVKTQEELEAFIATLTDQRKQFVFYQVNKLGKAKVKIELSLDV